MSVRDKIVWMFWLSICELDIDSDFFSATMSKTDAKLFEEDIQQFSFKSDKGDEWDCTMHFNGRKIRIYIGDYSSGVIRFSDGKNSIERIIEYDKYER